MKIFSASQLKEADRFTVEKQEISTTDLMERAGSKLFAEIDRRLNGAAISVKIFCGVGNNGGDGLVIGRLLIEKGYLVTIYVVNYSDQRSRDFLVNYDRVKNLSRDWPVLLTKQENFPTIEVGDFVIDAIFGVGLNRPLPGWVNALVQHVNSSGAFVLAVDLPSGMIADSPPLPDSAIIRADFTLTLQAPKMAFFFPDTAPMAGDVHVIDIGLDPEFLRKSEAVAEFVGKQQVKRIYRPRSRFSHKGDYGHALMVGGSYGKIGSIILSTEAALRTGCGLVTAFIPSRGYTAMQSRVPEAMVLTDQDPRKITDVQYQLNPAAVAFGVGVGTAPESVTAMEQMLRKVKDSMVIDADGLNILASNKALLSLVPRNSILTPHPKELERLIGAWTDDFEKIEKAKSFCRTHDLILVIKGAYTMTVTAEQLVVNSSGNSGMATAGSGDVLTGMITALLAQGYAPLAGAVLGVFIHGRAGDIAAENLGLEGVIAGDIVGTIGLAFRDIFLASTQEDLNKNISRTTK